MLRSDHRRCGLDQATPIKIRDDCSNEPNPLRRSTRFPARLRLGRATRCISFVTVFAHRRVTTVFPLRLFECRIRSSVIGKTSPDRFRFRLMFDLVAESFPSRHILVSKFLAGDPDLRRFPMRRPPRGELSASFAPRALPLVDPFESAAATIYVWTTFSAEFRSI